MPAITVGFPRATGAAEALAPPHASPLAARSRTHGPARLCHNPGAAHRRRQDRHRSAHSRSRARRPLGICDCFFSTLPCVDSSSSGPSDRRERPRVGEKGLEVRRRRARNRGAHARGEPEAQRVGIRPSQRDDSKKPVARVRRLRTMIALRALPRPKAL